MRPMHGAAAAKAKSKPKDKAAPVAVGGAAVGPPGSSVKRSASEMLEEYVKGVTMKARAAGAGGGAEELPRWDDEGSDDECVEITDDAFAVRGVSYAALHALDALVPDYDDSHEGCSSAEANTADAQAANAGGRRGRRCQLPVWGTRAAARAVATATGPVETAVVDVVIVVRADRDWR